MRKLSVAAAGDRLAVEDAIEAVDRRISEHVDAAERKRVRERDVARLLDGWDELPFAERHSGLRDAISRITVTDDAHQDHAPGLSVAAKSITVDAGADGALAALDAVRGGRTAARSSGRRCRTARACACG